ncbi:MAG: cell envelope integrity protein TolA [Gammaproteobacteria bacterium]|nr:cell envelope integrity protein TolA [Gammaproteobacteria bacterium]
MLSLIRDNPRAFALAFLIHVTAIVVLAMHVDWWSPDDMPPVKVIQATVIDESKLNAEKEKKRAEEERQQREAEDRQRAIEEKRIADQRRQEEVKRKVEEDLKHKQAEVKRQEDAKKRIVEEKKVAETEKNRKLEVEKQRKSEEDRQRKADDAKHKAEVEQQRKEAEARRRDEEEERALQKQLAAEDDRLRAEHQHQHQMQQEIDKYRLLIQQAIENRWIQPADWKRGTSCVVEVRLVPGAGGGQVLDARVVRSCGSPLLNKSVETAVFGASPLPVPRDSTMWNEFRVLNITFKPK